MSRNSLDCPREAGSSRYLNGLGPLVVFLARVNGKKGVDLLIAAVARVMAQAPETRLAIIGRADPRSFERRVRDWIRSSGIESKTVMTVAGSEERLEMVDAYIYALPSQAENFGFSIFEAMARSSSGGDQRYAQ